MKTPLGHRHPPVLVPEGRRAGFGQIVCLAITVGLVFIETAFGQTLYRITDLGALSNAVRPASAAYGLNNAGHVVGTTHIDDEFNRHHAFFWSPETGMKAIDPFKSGFTIAARGINDHDQVVGIGYLDPHSSIIRGFRWTAAGGISELAPVIDGVRTEALAINDSGVSTGSSSGLTGGTLHIVRWPATGGPQTIATSDGYGYAINSSGHIAGDSGGRAFIWRPGSGTTLLSTLPSQALGINDLDQVVGYTATDTPIGAIQHPTLWKPDGTTIDLGVLPNCDAAGSYASDINNLGQVIGNCANFGSTPFIWSSTHGMHSLLSLVDPADPLRARLDRIEAAAAINDKGQIVGTGVFYLGDGPNTVFHALLLTPLTPPLSVDLIDPVPLKPGDPSLIRGKAVTSDSSTLATNSASARRVRGVAADGVAQVVLRIGATTVGEAIDVRIKPGQCKSTGAVCVDDYGRVFDPKSPPSDVFNSNPGPDVIRVRAVSTSQGPAAFAVYRAPIDFVRMDSTANAALDKLAPKRTVTVTIDRVEARQIRDVSIEIVRPPVFLVHGNWSDPTAWDQFSPISTNTDERFRSYRINYSISLPLGVADSVPVLFGQVHDFMNAYRRNVGVASVQGDHIVHSMGGLLVRTSVLNKYFYSNFAFGRGPVHKLITLDTPHSGSGFASRLLGESSSCWAAFTKHGFAVQQNIKDLADGSDLLKQLSVSSVGVHIPTHAVVGVANEEQTKDAQDRYFSSSLASISSWFRYLYCPTLLPKDGFSKVLGAQNDLVVSEVSQSAEGLGWDGIIPTTQIKGVIHAVASPLFMLGPDVLGKELLDGNPVKSSRASEIVDKVIGVLNSPVTSSSFRRIIP